MYRGTNIRMTGGIVLKTMQARRQWNDMFKALKD